MPSSLGGCGCIGYMCEEVALAHMGTLTVRCWHQDISLNHIFILFTHFETGSLAILARLAGQWGPAVYLFLRPHDPGAEVTDTQLTFYRGAMDPDSGVMLV